METPSVVDPISPVNDPETSTAMAAANAFIAMGLILMAGEILNRSLLKLRSRNVRLSDVTHIFVESGVTNGTIEESVQTTEE